MPMTVLLIVANGILTICYSLTLFMMIKAIYSLVISELRTERDSVIIQFSLLLFSFLTRFLYYLVQDCVWPPHEPMLPFWW